MPVVVFSKASTDTVKRVPILAVFTFTMGTRSNLSILSLGKGTQISPRACLEMKFIASGVTFSAAITMSPSFSLSASSTTTTIFPSLISSIASSMVFNFSMLCSFIVQPVQRSIFFWPAECPSSTCLLDLFCSFLFSPSLFC